MIPYSKEWWTSRCEDEEESLKVFEMGSMQAGNLVEYIGRWSFYVPVLDVNAGPGVMVQLLLDSGFQNVVGVDQDKDMSELWDIPDVLVHADPWDMPFEDNQFKTVTWFSAHEGTVPEDKFDAVLEEIDRVGSGHLMGKFYTEWSTANHEDLLRKMLDHHMSVVRFNPHLLFYIFQKG